jgi:hypothetical protein
MKRILEIYKVNFRDGKFRFALFTAILFLALSLFVNYFAGTYATEHAGNSVSDLILSNIRNFDVDGIFIYGALIFWVGVLLILIKDMRLAPFVLKSISLFVVIRSFFITLTHIGPFPEQTTLASNFLLNKLTFGGDLFFSGHTGLPFLLVLVFWKNKYLRYTFLAASVFFGVSTLLGHYHYSIDVFAAYFITYSIFHLAQKFFGSDLKIFNESPVVAPASNAQIHNQT